MSKLIAFLFLTLPALAQVGFSSHVQITGGQVTNGIETTPSMGWNPWQVYGAGATQALVEANCLAASTDGLLAAGYNYCGVDGVWTTSRVGGVLTPTSSYPSMSGLGTYIHSLGEKYTIYMNPGPSGSGCDGTQASGGYDAQDIALFASWGVDYVKADTCYHSWTTTTAIAEYQGLQSAMAASGRQMRLFASIGPSECGSSTCAYSYTWFSSIGASEDWSEDDLTYLYPGAPPYWMTYANLITSIESLYGITSYAGPNHFLFPGLQLGVGNSVLTDAQGIADFSLMAEMASPLFVSIDLTVPPSANTMATLTNKQVIAVDQDPAGNSGSRVSQVACGSYFCEVYAKPLAGTNKWAIVLWNQDTSAHSITVNWSMFSETGPYTNTANLWANWPNCGGATSCAASLGTLSTGYTATVPAYSTVMMTVAP
jgi:alpha-galactosidase